MSTAAIAEAVTALGRQRSGRRTGIGAGIRSGWAAGLKASPLRRASKSATTGSTGPERSHR